jgi:hypothetical protein
MGRPEHGPAGLDPEQHAVERLEQPVDALAQRAQERVGEPELTPLLSEESGSPAQS